MSGELTEAETAGLSYAVKWMELCLAKFAGLGRDEGVYQAERDHLFEAKRALRKLDQIRKQQFARNMTEQRDLDEARRVDLATEIASRRVRIPFAAAMTGLNERTIQRYIQNGTWLEGHEFHRTADGEFRIDITGFERWVEGGRRPM